MKKIAVWVLFFLLFAGIAKAQKKLPPCFDCGEKRDIKPDTINTFTSVEISPEFPGGLKGWFHYLKKNLKYPKGCADTEKVYVSFIVERDGSLSNIKVVSQLSRQTDAEALRLLTNSPKWTPGMLGNVIVRVNYGVNIHFPLNRY